jgi:hypothetical protein
MVSATSAARERFISALVVRIEAAGSFTSLAAWPCAKASSSAAGSTFATMPISKASCARKASPSISFSAARV